MVARMIEKGWLGRERSTVDGRAKTVRLTEKGAAALKDIAPKVAAADERILANLTASRRSGFIGALAALADAGGAEAAEAESKAKKKAEKLAKADRPKAAKSKDTKDKKKKKKAKKAHAAE
jgi:DNA-binding PadR family transcriptional regulator